MPWNDDDLGDSTQALARDGDIHSILPATSGTKSNPESKTKKVNAHRSRTNSMAPILMYTPPATRADDPLAYNALGSIAKKLEIKLI